MSNRRSLLNVVSKVALSAARPSLAPICYRTHYPVHHAALPPQHPKPKQFYLSSRWHSLSASKSKAYTFEEIKSLVNSPSTDRILIDVREPSEYIAGFIPTALNVPITSSPDALFLDPDDFRDKFGFVKPPLSKEIVFYCKAGVRSSAAAQLALQHGYQKVGEYRGSWLEWEKRSRETSLGPKEEVGKSHSSWEKAGG